MQFDHFLTWLKDVISPWGSFGTKEGIPVSTQVQK